MATEVARLGELVLMWLLTQKAERGAPTKLLAALRPLVEHQWSGGEWSAHLEQTVATLERDGAIRRGSRGGLSLTEEGRARALSWLGVKRLLPRTSWKAFKNTYLIAKVLGLPLSSEVLKRIGSADGVQAALLRHHFQLAIPDAPTLIQARDALAWRQLKKETDRPFKIRDVFSVLFQMALESSRESEPEQALRQLAARSVGARRTGPDELRRTVLRSWVLPGEQGPLRPGKEEAGKEEDLRMFAERVLDAARSSPSGRFGDDRVFISHVWRALKGGTSLNERSFKNRLLEANRARLLALSRADLVEAMDPADVAASEIRYLGATFHFVAI